MVESGSNETLDIEVYGLPRETGSETKTKVLSNIWDISETPHYMIAQKKRKNQHYLHGYVPVDVNQK